MLTIFKIPAPAGLAVNFWSRDN